MYDLTRSRIRSTHIHAAICKARVIYELLPKFLRKILRTHIYCILYTRGIGYSLSSRQTSMAMDGRAAATPCSHHKNKLYGIFAFVFAFSFPPDRIPLTSPRGIAEKQPEPTNSRSISAYTKCSKYTHIHGVYSIRAQRELIRQSHTSRKFVWLVMLLLLLLLHGMTRHRCTAFWSA